MPRYLQVHKKPQTPADHGSLRLEQQTMMTRPRKKDTVIPLIRGKTGLPY
ncbi:hypothetical protein L248_1944 [Schleiferilactobacillus shenzhenensis LY-73]|uniref:Uncharacterized protein n=1 Tax=Schleiferilactobacillus shenzhenensis LY-73 TaxID=1231336 RepID=U4TVK5_9LACO|nr:hypothetical protein L248_1944 [Schleiferilactobacillus shenzhenensis LY-73]